MDTIIAEIKEQKRIPNRVDIARLLAGVGEPGERREEKDAAVRRLFDELGQLTTNFQGHDATDSLHLSSYQEY